MSERSRREFLKVGLAATAGAACAEAPWVEAASPEGLEEPLGQLRYSCFYQVSRNAIDFQDSGDRERQCVAGFEGNCRC